MMERLIAVSQDAVFKLESEPVSTVDFVNLLKSVHVKCHVIKTLMVGPDKPEIHGTMYMENHEHSTLAMENITTQIHVHAHVYVNIVIAMA